MLVLGPRHLAERRARRKLRLPSPDSVRPDPDEDDVDLANGRAGFSQHARGRSVEKEGIGSDS